MELRLPRDRFDHASVPMGAQRHGGGFSDLGETGLGPQLFEDVQQLPEDGANIRALVRLRCVSLYKHVGHLTKTTSVEHQVHRHELCGRW